MVAIKEISKNIIGKNFQEKIICDKIEKSDKENFFNLI